MGIDHLQINRHTVLVDHQYSQSNSLKTKLLSPLSATPATQQRPDLDEEETLLEDEVKGEDVAIPGGVVLDSKKSEVVVDNNTTTLTTEVEEEALVVDEDLVGKTTINHSATAMLLSTSSLIGRCWRRLISTVSRNSTWILMRERISRVTVSCITTTELSTSRLSRLVTES